jgi:molybdenum cofactor sulfurtransferase
MSVHKRLYGPNPMKFISVHTTLLGRRLRQLLFKMRHSNGIAVIQTYGDGNTANGCPRKQGVTVAQRLSSRRELRRFQERRTGGGCVAYCIYIHSDFFCDPGGVVTYFEWANEDLRLTYASGHRCSSPVQFTLAKPTGVVRVSLGAMTARFDLDKFLQFIRRTCIQ